MTSRDEREALERFRERYAIPAGDIADVVERRVIGAAWGANGYTTLDQADELARRLKLGPGDLLLDVGTGRGWPALYLAARTGCRVVGADMPLDALRVAAERARVEGLGARAALVAASAVHLPFRPQTFDAVVHTDVLCCLQAKHAVLRALLRLLRPGGRMACFTIHVTPGLPPAARRRAVRSGPRGVATPSSYRRLLTGAGFVDVEEVDVTAAFLRTTRAWLTERAQRAAELTAVESAAVFAERQQTRRALIAGIQAGLLRRALLTAARPLAAPAQRR